MNEPRRDLGEMFARITQRLVQAERPILERHGLSMWEYVVLSRLAAGTAPTQRTLAQDVGHDPTRLIGVIDALETAGLLTRHPDPSDRRARVVEITEQGRRRHAAVQGEIHAMEDALLDDLAPADRATLDRLLRQLGADRR
ncbi:MAG TPA: MarR family transcriptional regulator [Solirubrobacteraceae bacterium]|jgi:DNA-binding MarR family transcriptional regulator|nr:MarR family transcriptional regulator [Solirubrobacteraceae bacterium]